MHLRKRLGESPNSPRHSEESKSSYTLDYHQNDDVLQQPTIASNSCYISGDTWSPRTRALYDATSAISDDTLGGMPDWRQQPVDKPTRQRFHTTVTHRRQTQLDDNVTSSRHNHNITKLPSVQWAGATRLTRGMLTSTRPLWKMSLKTNYNKAGCGPSGPNTLFPGDSSDYPLHLELRLWSDTGD